MVLFWFLFSPINFFFIRKKNCEYAFGIKSKYSFWVSSLQLFWYDFMKISKRLHSFIFDIHFINCFKSDNSYLNCRNVLPLTFIFKFFIWLYGKLAGEQSIGLVSSVENVTRPTPVKITTLISLLFLDWRTTLKSNQLRLSYSGVYWLSLLSAMKNLISRILCLLLINRTPLGHEEVYSKWWFRFWEFMIWWNWWCLAFLLSNLVGVHLYRFCMKGAGVRILIEVAFLVLMKRYVFLSTDSNLYVRGTLPM